jgi:CBS domain-containing protein
LPLDKFKVEDVYRPEIKHCEIISLEEDLEQVLKKFSGRTDINGFFVVDEKEKIKGIITRKDLLNFAKFKLGGELKPRIIRKFIYSNKVKDLISVDSSRVTINLTDYLRKALDIMTENELIDLPIIDKEGKIIGELDLSDILLKSVKF